MDLKIEILMGKARELEEDLDQLVRENCTTYSEVNEFLANLEDTSRSRRERVLMAVIKNVMVRFSEERERIPLKERQDR